MTKNPPKMRSKADLEDELHRIARTRLKDERNNAPSELTGNWEDAYRYYRGEAPGPTDSHDSTVVSTDVSDTIEWVLPAVLKPLISSPDVVRFDPTSPEDVEQAALESDFVHSTFMKKCRGFEKLYVHIKDALLLKNAVFCTFWDEGYKNQKETYKDLTEIELADLLHPSDGSKVRLVSQAQRQVPLINVLTGAPLTPADMQAIQQLSQPQQPPQEPPQAPQGGPQAQGAPQQPPAPQAPQAPPEPPMEARFDVEIRRYWENGRPVVENCAPEAFGVNLTHDSISLTDARFCWYTLAKTRSELVSLGYSEDDIDECPKGLDREDDEVRYSREDVERDANWDDEDTDTPSQTLYAVHRVYLRYDADGDGYDEQYLVILGGPGGEVMFDHYEVPENPFSASTPFIAGHKFYGYSLFDKLRELADHKTKVLRMLEDNLDLANNPRVKGVRGMFVLDDVLTRQVGGLWRVDDINAVTEVPVLPISQQAQELLNYYDKMRAERSGVDPNAQSLSSLPEESMNHAVERVLSAKEELVGMLIRTFAETGIKDMFLKLRGVLMRNLDKDQLVQLRNKWVTINPATWVERTDSTVVVGLGTGDKMRKSAALQQVLEIQMQAMQGGLSGVLVSPQRMAHTIKELIRMQELGDPDDFVLDPNLLLDQRNAFTPRGQEIMMAQQLQQQMQQQMQMEQQQKAQMEQQAQQAQMQMQQELVQSQQKIAEIQAQSQLQRTQIQEQARAQSELAKLQSEMQRFQEEMRLKWAELAATETAAEDSLVVEKAKLEMGLAQKEIDAEQKERDREVTREGKMVDADQKERDRGMAREGKMIDAAGKQADREAKEKQAAMKPKPTGGSK